ncbi:MAG: hypothetical protein K9I84_16520 [Leadbetterella sp.]|nr:hypothetical protein [Leadbetterella sp.]
MTENSKIIKTTELNEQAKKQVLDLWNNEYPEKLSYNSMIEIEKAAFPKLKTLSIAMHQTEILQQYWQSSRVYRYTRNAKC